jgi:predicted dehydrogenase/threonine dehydrogenase-like Zn-dependent dehydrogenase
MKQLFQNLKTGATTLEELPVPAPGYGQLLIKTSFSLVSLGTERMLVEFGKAGLLQKARSQPQKVRQVLDKMKTDGVGATLNAVRSRLEEPLPLGYCNCGAVVAVGEGAAGYAVGDTVVSNGPHAEMVCVPTNLAAKVPDGVEEKDAVFTVMGAIGLQGLRLAQPTLGETVVVYGLGLVGLLTAQLAKANGCRVIGIDIDREKRELARTLGIEPLDGADPVPSVLAATGEVGADAVIITASAQSNAIVKNSAQMCRQRGRVVLVGVVGLELDRADFYAKEISFSVSCSYGPGRYDPLYEEHNIDYPVGFVRWTEQRNFEAVLHCMRSGALRTTELISACVPFEMAPSVYTDMDAGTPIATLFIYPERIEQSRTITLQHSEPPKSKDAPVLGVVGAGLHIRSTLLPAIVKSGLHVEMICSKGGGSAAGCAKKYTIPQVTTDIDEILNNKRISHVVIATRHNLHAQQIIAALKAEKQIFVEKPLCLTVDEFFEILKVYCDVNGLPLSRAMPAEWHSNWVTLCAAPAIGQHVDVGEKWKKECELRSIDGSSGISNTDTKDRYHIKTGFNRRYAPMVTRLKEELEKQSGPCSAIFTVNAGKIPQNHWTQDPEVGGGRIIGEAVHWVDLFEWIAESPVQTVYTQNMGESGDTVSITMKCENGSVGTVHYFANGNKRESKEKIVVYKNGTSVRMDNYKELVIVGKGKVSVGKGKGHGEMVEEI